MKLNFGKRLALFLHWLMALIAAVMAVMYCVWPNTIADLLEKLETAVGKQKADIIGMTAQAAAPPMNVRLSTSLTERDMPFTER